DLAAACGILSAEESRGTIASYNWEQIDGPDSSATSATNTATLAFTAPALDKFQTIGLVETDRGGQADQFKWQPLPIARNATSLFFRLTVTDADGLTDADEVKVFLQDTGAVIHEASGLPNVGLNTTVYLSGPALRAVSTGTGTQAITDWTWTISTKPEGSSAAFADTGTGTSNAQMPKFVPDIAGVYVMHYCSTSAGISCATPGILAINAARYVGVGTVNGATPTNPECAACHNGTLESDTVTGWSGSIHAGLFQENISTFAAQAPESPLWPFMTVGYDTDAANDGFDDLLAAGGNPFTSDQKTFALFSAAQPEATKLTGVQCENCHGPGSLHSGDPTRTSFSASQFGVCGQCHVEGPQWINSAHNSTGIEHGSGRYQSSWLTTAHCTRCHTAAGFATYVGDNNLETNLAAVTETGAFVGVTCAGCHDPHDATNPNQLRTVGNVHMFVDGSTVNAGLAAVCYTCHDGLYTHGSANMCDTNADGVGDAYCDNTLNNPTVAALTGKSELYATATQYFRQIHPQPQGATLEGKGAITDLLNDGTETFALSENSFHSGTGFTLAGVTGDATLSADDNKCVTCHMAAGPTIDEEGYNHLGGHAFKMREGHSIGHLEGSSEDIGGVAGEAGELENVSACNPCHPSETAFNRTARADYDGDGSREGIQDEIKGLLFNLSEKLKAVDAITGTTPPNLLATSGTTVVDGAIVPAALSWDGANSSLPTGKNCTTTPPVLGIETYPACNFTQAVDDLKAAVWNYNLIEYDASLGVHNAAFSIQVLQKTYDAISLAHVTAGPAGTEGKTYTGAFPLAVIR
ncbi:MAG: cytochrome c3 family protein, partial [Pseudomonadota bacterium]